MFSDGEGRLARVPGAPDHREPAVDAADDFEPSEPSETEEDPDNPSTSDGAEGFPIPAGRPRLKDG